MNDQQLRLTAEERLEGWHFCFDWDELLVGPGMMEREFCHCFDKPQPAPAEREVSK